MKIDELAALCRQLRAEPLFHLSLQSKELFHSNVIAWICEHHPTIAAATFNRWIPRRDQTPGHRVQRERTRLDLAIELPGLAPFIIENKVFSPPDTTQLDTYAAGPLAGLEHPELILLSLGDPGWPDRTHHSPTGQTWRHVSYQELADALDDAAAAVGGGSLDGFDAELITRYARFARLLHQLAAAGAVEADDPIDVTGPARSLLREARLHDAVGKLRARAALAAVRAHNEPLLAEVRIRWGANFSNGTAITEAFIAHRDGDELGWQHQGGQWRLAVATQRHAGSTSELRARRHTYVAERYGDWFDFTAISELTGRDISSVPPTEAAGRFNGYNPDFVYRYRKVPDLTLAELTALSQHYLTAAVEYGGR